MFSGDSLKHVRRTEKCWRLFGDNVGILSVTLEKKSMWKKAFPAPSIMHSAKGYVIEALIIFHSSPNMANLDPWLTTIGKRRLKYYLDRLEKMEGFPHFMEIQFCRKWLRFYCNLCFFLKWAIANACFIFNLIVVKRKVSVTFPNFSKIQFTTKCHPSLYCQYDALGKVRKNSRVCIFLLKVVRGCWRNRWEKRGILKEFSKFPQ